MAQHRIRRWFQFGVLDLLIIAAIGAVLWRPVRAETSHAAPWVIGVWEGVNPSQIALFPDGCYYWLPTRNADTDVEWGFSWKLSRRGNGQDGYVLECSKHHTKR